MIFVARLRPGRMVTRQRTMNRGVHNRECGSLVEGVSSFMLPYLFCFVFFFLPGVLMKLKNNTKLTNKQTREK